QTCRRCIAICCRSPNAKAPRRAGVPHTCRTPSDWLMSMQLGVHISKFTWAGGPTAIAADLKRVAQTADEAGFAKLSVMDHVWQIGHIGPPEFDMLEAYTTLGYLAAHTTRINLLAWVTAVVYRDPGLLAKQVTTLDVLSGGRA